MTSLGQEYELLLVMVTHMSSLAPNHDKQCLPCSVNISVTLQTEIISTDFLKQMNILRSCFYCQMFPSLFVQ